ncbi:MAG: DedA family protein, partial [Solirubrobacterales bacterium]|nr:DedA family protein [Solirubrobacterales bacterium]
AIVGEKVGDNWEDWRHKLGYLDYLVVAAIVVGVVYLVVKRRRGGGAGKGGDPATAPEPTGTSGA